MAIRSALPGSRLGLALLGALALTLLAGAVAVGIVRGGSRSQDPVGHPASVSALQLPGAAVAAAPRPAAVMPLPPSADVSPTAAVTSYLAARRNGAVDVAYDLLSPASRGRYPTPAVWRSKIADLPAPGEFQLLGSAPTADGTEVTAQVQHNPSLDSFTGFVAAQTREVYRAVQAPGSGWRVDALPIRVTPTLPPDATATAAVQTWIDSAAACDGAAAIAGQVSENLLGDDSLPGGICAAHVPLHAGSVEPFSGGPDVAPFLAAYGPALGAWARLVPVTGPDRQLLVGVAPLGSAWRVFGIVSGTAS